MTNFEKQTKELIRKWIESIILLPKEEAQKELDKMNELIEDFQNTDFMGK